MSDGLTRTTPGRRLAGKGSIPGWERPNSWPVRGADGRRRQGRSFIRWFSIPLTRQISRGSAPRYLLSRPPPSSSCACPYCSASATTSSSQCGRTPNGGHVAWDAATRLQDPLLPVQHVAVAVTDRLHIDGGRCGPRRHRQEALEQRRVTPVALERRVELWRCRCRACSCLRSLWALWRG